MLAPAVDVELGLDKVVVIGEMVVVGDFTVVGGLVEVVAFVVVVVVVVVGLEVVVGGLDVVCCSVEVCVVTVVLIDVGIELIFDGALVDNSCVDDVGDIVEVVVSLVVEVVVGLAAEVGRKVVCCSFVANAEVEELGVRDEEDSAISGFVVGDLLGVSVGRVVEVVVVGGNFVVTIRQE